MVLTRRMAKERATTGANDGEHNHDVFGTDPTTQVSSTKASMSPATGVYGDEAKAFINNHAPLHGGTMTNGAQTPQISTENRNTDACALATGSGEPKRRRARKITASTKLRQATTKSGGLNLVNDSDLLNGSINSPSGDPQLRRGQKRRRDEGDNNKENAAVPSQDTPSKRRARRRTAKAASSENSTEPADENLPRTVEVLSNSSPSHHAANIVETSNDEVFAHVLLKLSGGGRNELDASPSPTAALACIPEKKSISNGMTEVDNGVVRRLLELFDLKKAEDESEQMGVTNAGSYLYPALFANRPNRVL